MSQQARPKTPASPRVPKLAVRNRLPEHAQPEQGLPILSRDESKQDEDAITPAPLRSITADGSSQASTRTSSDQRSSSDSRSAPASSLAPNGPSQPTPKDQKKKKSSSMLGFLTLKEPSTLAFEQYAEQQRKQGSTVAPVGLSGNTTQKLPPNVPKVNSKWDGLPEALKAKEKAKTKRDSSIALNRSTKDVTLHSSNASISSGGSGNPKSALTFQGQSQWRGSNSQSPSNSSLEAFGRVLSSPSTVGPSNHAASGVDRPPSMSDLPEISYFFPPDSPESKARPDGRNLSPGGSSPETSPRTPADATFPAATKSPSVQMPGRLDFIAPWATTPIAIPAKPPVSEKTDSIFAVKPVSDLPVGFLASEAQEMKLSDSEEAEDKRSNEDEDETLDENALNNKSRPQSYQASVAPSAKTNFSRPLSSALPHSIVPTGTQWSDTQRASDPSNPIALQQWQLSKDSQRDDTASIAESAAPSEMSAQWYRSPRERLGLGGRLKKADVLPWEEKSEAEVRPSDKKKKSRLSSFIKGAT